MLKSRSSQIIKGNQTKQTNFSEFYETLRKYQICVVANKSQAQAWVFVELKSHISISVLYFC